MNRDQDTRGRLHRPSGSIKPPFSLDGAGMSNYPSKLDDQTLFGILGRDAYLHYAPPPPNDPEYAIRQIEASFSVRTDNSNAAQRSDRTKMFANYEELLSELSTNLEARPLDLAYSFVARISPLAAKELGENRANLGLHLQEITDFCRSFYLTPSGESRFPNVLNNREALLLAEVIAPLHDVLKYIGSFQSSVMPDHEVLTAELVRRSFMARRVILNGQEHTLTAQDVEFIATVIGDHENINKEQGRADWVNSHNSTERAKALFFVADVLTGVIVEQPAGSNQWAMNLEQLNKRFVDLYVRHIDLHRGKVFRPEWGLSAIEDLSTTLEKLVSHGCSIRGGRPNESARETIVKAALAGVDRALASDDAFKRDTLLGNFEERSSKFLSDRQLERIAGVSARLEELLALPRPPASL